MLLGVIGVIVAVAAIVVSVALYYWNIQRKTADQLVDQYMFLYNTGKTSGPRALAELGLHLHSNKVIRDVMQKIESRTGRNPWYGNEKYVEGVDLRRFFGYMRENQLNFNNTTAEKIVKGMKAESDRKKN